MDSWTQLWVDSRFGTIFGGCPILSFGALLGLLGANKAGTQCGILVLPDSHRDFDLDVCSKDVSSSIYGRY